MTKTDLVEFVAEKTGFTKADSSRALEAVIEGITKGLKKEGKVVITGFLTATAKHKDAKQGHNPRTGEKLTIPARIAVTFKAGSKLKDALN
ncbi:MAG: HU family DNA-binding protein [Clostridium sp.]|nr:HU family DNA-binding protein [Clostridium sp.]MCM1444166.1 HU family DNA-binding protein [Candidatus Amulumruptor caecigallinarius]